MGETGLTVCTEAASRTWHRVVRVVGDAASLSQTVTHAPGTGLYGSLAMPPSMNVMI